MGSNETANALKKIIPLKTMIYNLVIKLKLQALIIINSSINLYKTHYA